MKNENWKIFLEEYKQFLTKLKNGNYLYLNPITGLHLEINKAFPDDDFKYLLGDIEYQHKIYEKANNRELMIK